MAMVSAELSASEEEEMRVSMVRSYGNSVRAVERRYGLFMHIAVLMFALMTVANPVWAPAWAEAAKPLKLVVLGDSLSAGLGLPAQDAFPAKLQKALQAKGIAADMINAGVSGDTSSGGRDRLDWSVPDGTEGVIVELGANDAMRGIDPDLTRAALTDIVG